MGRRLGSKNGTWHGEENAERRKQYFRERKNRREDENTRLVRTYGISLDFYEKLLEAQEGKCKLCSKTSQERLHVDHDHSNGLIRGLLCKGCNFFVGRVEAVGGPGKVAAYLSGPHLLPDKTIVPKRCKSAEELFEELDNL